MRLTARTPRRKRANNSLPHASVLPGVFVYRSIGVSRKAFFAAVFALFIGLTFILQACAEPDSTPTAIIAPSGAVVATSDRTVTVTRVIDGDTVDVCCPEARVRLLGIDSPERDEPLFNEATALAERLAEGQEARLEKCLEEADQYGRLLRHIFVGDTHVNREMVASGLATAYEFSLNLNPCYETELRSDQSAAQANAIGMWEQ